MNHSSESTALSGQYNNRSERCVRSCVQYSSVLVFDDKLSKLRAMRQQDGMRHFEAPNIAVYLQRVSDCLH